MKLTVSGFTIRNSVKRQASSVKHFILGIFNIPSWYRRPKPSSINIAILVLSLVLNSLALLPVSPINAQSEVNTAGITQKMNTYIQQRGFYQPETETVTIDDQQQTVVKDLGGYKQAILNNQQGFETLRDYAVTYGSKSGADPELIVWWSLIETDQKFNPYTYSNCGPNNTKIAPQDLCTVNSIQSDNWQIAYGQQYTTAQTSLVQAYQAVYNDPSNTTKVQSVIQNVMAKANISGSAPSGLTVQDIQDKSGLNEPNRRWAYYLSKDPGISAYLLGTSLVNFNRQEAFSYPGDYYQQNWQAFSNALYHVLANWGTPKTPSADFPNTSTTLGGPTEPPIDLTVPDCPDITRTINAYNLPPSIYPKPSCGPGTAGAGANHGQPTGKYGTSQDAPDPNTLFWVITGGQPYPLSQGYGLTGFASNHTHEGGMYHYCNDYGVPGHCGIDLATPVGTAIYSPVDGQVVCDGTSASRQGDPTESCVSFGNQNSPHTYKGRLEIKLDNGDFLIFGHMERIDVRIGNRVTIGQPLGQSGQMINEGGHLHLEYRTPDASQSSGKTTYDPRDIFDVPYNSGPTALVPTKQSLLTQNNSTQVLAETNIATNYSQFQAKYGFLQPNGASPIDWDLYKEQFVTVRDTATIVAPKFNIEPEMIVWWVFFETRPPYNSYTYSNCLDTASLSKVEIVCPSIASGGWQVGYGQQYGQALDLVEEAFQNSHGNPNDTALVAQVIQNVMQKSSLDNDFPGNLTVSQMINNEPTYRKWIFALQRDPGISLYILGRELRNDINNAVGGRSFAQVMEGWSPYYRSQETKQRYSNILNDILLNWGIAGSTISGDICQIGVSTTSGGCSTITDNLGSYTDNIAQFVADINQNMAAYKEIAQCANVPWQMMAAIHWRETELDANYTGPGTGGAQGPWQIDPTGAIWGTVDPHNFTEAGCAVGKQELQSKAQSGPLGRALSQDMDPNKKDDEYSIKDAFFAYNGRAGFEQNIPKGCTPGLDNNPQLNFDCSAYVMGNWDSNHLNMTIGIGGGQEYADTRDGTWKVFYKLYFSTYGANGELLVYGGNCTLANEVIDGFAAPTKSGLNITSKFWQEYTGAMAGQGHHKGIDIAAQNGEPIFAIANGTIIQSGFSEGAGYHIILHVPSGTNGSTNDRWVYYGHLSADGLIEKNAQVIAGQQIGKVGKTVEMVNGHPQPNGITTGEHLHFDIRTTAHEGATIDEHVNPCSIKVFLNSYPGLSCTTDTSGGAKWID